MVSSKSWLYCKHPDWCLGVSSHYSQHVLDGSTKSTGRNKHISRHQMVLDLSRYEVREYIFQSICNVLRSANIEYIKWDMNRPLTEVCSGRGGMIGYHGQGVQGETAHRYVLGLYELQSRILDAFPGLIIENCASGGVYLCNKWCMYYSFTHTHDITLTSTYLW